ncbi:MAG: hypothetical protein IPO07_01465 [Haliscomenobacter sp.]|nr:hypothetical protein [Haliscomenobacter sp.]MBK9487582.1 hypothetical protein [Haliscomenobacter sp.]
MKKGIFIAAIFAVFFFNSCDLSSTYPQTDATETSAQMSPEETKMAAIKQKLAEKQELGEITDEQAAALLLLILAAIASESGNADAGGSTGYSNEYGNSGYSEDEVMDMVVDQAINPVGTINYNY